MGRSLQDIEAAVDAFALAAFDQGAWLRGADRLAAATGSRMAEVMGLVDGGGVPLHMLTGDLDKTVDDWISLDGAHPHANPMIRAGLRSPTDRIIQSAAVRSEGNSAERALFGDFFEPCDVPHIASAILAHEPGRHLVVSMMRREREGPLEGEALRIMELGVRAARHAAELGRAVGKHGAVVLKQGLELLDSAAVGLDRAGRVTMLTAAAERLVRQGWLDILNGEVTLPAPSRSAFVRAAIRVAAGGDPEGLTVRRRDRPGLAMTLSLARLDGGPGLLFSTALLATVRIETDLEVLTPAEATVLRLIEAGLTSREISARRGVSVETVRTQSKAIYAKLGLRGRLDLMRMARGHHPGG